jgi:hypothetical protein
MWAFSLFYWRALADRTTAPNLSLSMSEGLSPPVARALLAQAIEFLPEGELGELRHRQLIGRPRERHDGVSDFLEELGRKVKRGTAPPGGAGCLSEGPGLPGAPKLPRR